MKYLAATALSLALVGVAPANAEDAQTDQTSPDVAAVSPALAAYTQQDLEGEVWQRPDLSKRDRSIVTVASLIARDQPDDMPAEFRRALDNGVTPSELSEIITHLAFYTGWANAMSAVEVADKVFDARDVDASQLPSANPELTPIDEEAAEAHKQSLQETYGNVSQGVVNYTSALLFRELWRRPALEPRDRSLVTISALISNSHTGALSFHLNRAMDNGLTKSEASEVLTHLAFYAGWPNVFASMPVAKEVFNTRAEQ
ncbi:carboxymuconolactone decarboxylase family protein [Rhodovibrio salinarum]|uniref:Carboxymuconolactone decarboxylase family protein n=1 Tax=Rhodovibrio salinarum TaxID=1087 RepID=A0A934QGL2_9PROT|nr:carboxymuconolactone decarboxylase family protein [Rhodovibrio salinarum]MBK1696135.1 carboxymuconolactone decarboxylase family protein [Rhodovibrio salinarum]